MKRLLNNSSDKGSTRQILPLVPGYSNGQSTLNGDESDKGIDNKTAVVDDHSISPTTDIKHVSTYDRYDALENISMQDEGLVMEAPFQDQHEKLARPFKYLKRIYDKNPDSYIGRVIGTLNQNIKNNVMAEDLAQETQFLILQYVRMRNLRIPIRDDIVVSATNHMTSIYLNIIDLFTGDAGDPIDKDIEELFTLIIETTYSLQDTMTLNSFDKIDLEAVRKVIRGLRAYVIKLRNRE